VDGRRLFSNVFHDIDFTAGRPGHFLKVVPEKPKSGPYALTARQFDPRRKAAVSLRKSTAGDQAGRGIPPRDSILARIVLAARFNNQLALVNARVLWAIRVVFEFVISPAVAANFKLPLRVVGTRRVCPVKLVTPGKSPSFSGWKLGRRL
jgi:hypothetical protein